MYEFLTQVRFTGLPDLYKSLYNGLVLLLNNIYIHFSTKFLMSLILSAFIKLVLRFLCGWWVLLLFNFYFLLTT